MVEVPLGHLRHRLTRQEVRSKQPRGLQYRKIQLNLYLKRYVLCRAHPLLGRAEDHQGAQLFHANCAFEPKLVINSFLHHHLQ